MDVPTFAAKTSTSRKPIILLKILDENTSKIAEKVDC
jgi:hypothetical protein